MNTENAALNIIELNPEPKELPATVKDYPATVMGMAVTDEVTFGRAGDAIKALKALEKEVTDYFGPMKKSAHEAWKAICAKENDALAPINFATSHVRNQMNKYAKELERKRQEEERIARAKAEEEARKEREKLEEQARKAEAKGKEEKAEALRETAENVYAAPVETSVAPPLVKTGAATAGTAKHLEITVTDLPAFVAALVEQKSAMTMIKIDSTALKAWAKANAIEKFPGLRIENTVKAVVR